MAKHVIFQPSDLPDNEEVSDNVLWSAKFKIADEFKDIVPVGIFKTVNNSKDTVTYPLKYWQKEFTSLNFKLEFDFPYSKEYAWYHEDNEALRVTIKANDIATNYNQLILPKNIAKKILDELSLPMFGKMHPEKFYTKLVTFLDLSLVEFTLENNIFDILLELEILCEECIKYENFVEWRVH